MVFVASVEIIFDLFNFSLVCFNISVALDKHSSVSNGNSKRWICHLFFADPACSGTLSIQSGICIYLAVQTLNSRSQRKCGGSVMHFFKNKYIYIHSEKKTAKKNTKKKVLSTLKENRNSVSCVSFSSKKNANWSLIFAQCRASEFGQENFCRHLFYQGNPLHNGDLLVLYLR